VAESAREKAGRFEPCSFWVLLDEAGRQALRRSGTVYRRPAGAVVLREGDPAGAVLILLAGRVKVVAGSPGGGTAVLAVRGPGDILGELSAVAGKRRMASVVAIEPVGVLRLSAERFDLALLERPPITRAVLRVVSDRLYDDGARRAAYASGTTARRLELLLAELAARHGADAGGGVQITLPFSQEDLARSIGASREAVVRGLRTLRALGIVRTGRQRIIVLRPDELERRAEAP
jgi:CRP-like cAMP-binding protein